MYGVIDRRALDSVQAQCDRIERLLADGERADRARAATCAFKSVSFTMGAFLSKTRRQLDIAPRLIEMTRRFREIGAVLLETCQEAGVPIDEVQRQMHAVDRQAQILEQQMSEMDRLQPDRLPIAAHDHDPVHFMSGGKHRRKHRPELEILALLQELADRARTLVTQPHYDDRTLEVRLEEFADRFHEIVHRINRRIESSDWSRSDLGKWRLTAESTENQLDAMMDRVSGQTRHRIQEMQVSLAFIMARVCRYDNDGIFGCVGTIE